MKFLKKIVLPVACLFVLALSTSCEPETEDVKPPTPNAVENGNGETPPTSIDKVL